MYPKKLKDWRHFHNDILSENVADAIGLELFLSRVRMSSSYLSSLEIIDLQRYRLVKQKHKIAALLQGSPKDRVFLFPVNLN